MVFGLFASVANDLMFLSVHVRLLIYYLLRSTYLSWPVYCIFSRFRSCSFGTVRHGCERTVFGSDLDGVRPFRIRCQRPHVFVCAGSVAYKPATVHLYLSWPVYCIFSRFRSCSFGTVRYGCERTVFGSDLDGVRPSFRIRCQRPHVFVCTRSVAHIPTTVQLPVLTCVLWILTVSKLQFRHREARLRTHGFWLGFRWCSAFSHPLPTTSCFCLRRLTVAYIPATVQLPVLTCVLCILCIF